MQDTAIEADDHYTNVREYVADRLQSGDEVEYAYFEDDTDEVKRGTGIVAKSNAGGVRIYRPGAHYSRAILIIKTTGRCLTSNREGNKVRTPAVGGAGSIRRTGKRVDIRYKHHTGYIVDDD